MIFFEDIKYVYKILINIKYKNIIDGIFFDLYILTFYDYYHICLCFLYYQY